MTRTKQNSDFQSSRKSLEQCVDLEEALRKIKDVDSLPTYEEALAVVSGYDDLGVFMYENHIHVFYNLEFIDSLARHLEYLGPSQILEVCAGKGKLAKHLRQRGLDVVASDLNKNENYVERISHSEALKKYNPSIVLGAWIPDSGIAFDIFDFPSVKYFVDIGERDGGTWCFQPLGRNTFGRIDYSQGIFFEKFRTISLGEDVVSRTDFTRGKLEGPTKSCLCNMDTAPYHDHGIVNLFTRVV